MRRRDIEYGMLVDVRPNGKTGKDGIVGQKVEYVGPYSVLVGQGWYDPRDIRPHVEGGAWAKKEAAKSEKVFGHDPKYYVATPPNKCSHVPTKTISGRIHELGRAYAEQKAPNVDTCSHCGQALSMKTLEERVAFFLAGISPIDPKVRAEKLIAMVRSEIEKEGKAK
jgi:hypothetical protein